MKKDVEAILDGLDKLVDDQFGRGEKAARDAFTAEHQRKMDEYKDRRYSGVTGKLRWVRDKFAGLPAEADKIFEEARDNYVRRMRQVISDVADTIGTELNRAKHRIAQGRAELQAAVRKLPADLRSIGQRAAAEFTDKFDELTQSADDKGTQLVDTLATKYTDALKSVDDEIAAEKEKNKGRAAHAGGSVRTSGAVPTGGGRSAGATRRGGVPTSDPRRTCCGLWTPPYAKRRACSMRKAPRRSRSGKGSRTSRGATASPGSR
ncbi:hypothetical protein SSPO_011880 [Streptomyces antimycoticus]|uniref:Uncharacterized protein n=1 Tax=Streptomyces antimycoticus TaxID=68175 RepID=A0A499UEU5_9ACTN|nr:hypothetical protein [Streptomyces antimycoticus]BBJ38470.1 hypothetical protein SSPO_011880 [Streptomyces antimycoticus]